MMAHLGGPVEGEGVDERPGGGLAASPRSVSGGVVSIGFVSGGLARVFVSGTRRRKGGLKTPGCWHPSVLRFSRLA